MTRIRVPRPADRRAWLRLAGLCVALLVGAAAPEPGGGAAGAGGQSRAQVAAQVRAMATLGEKMFTDPGLSASGRMACASCHNPEHRFGPPNGRAVQLGGRNMKLPGGRAVPSLTYLQAVPAFTEHFFESDDEGDESIDNGPTGGLTWDGRVDRGANQARLPLLSSFEMANRTPAEVAAKLKRSAYAPEMRSVFGADLFDDPERTFAAALKSLEVFQQDAAKFYPYDSKYDAYLAGKATLSAQETRGLLAFNDPEKGNCAHCHVSKRGLDGSPPQFTDYGLIAIGVPRNRAIPANRDPSFHDLGVCGPERTDLRDHPEYCGLFRTPSLRNVVLRKRFFHNGLYRSLRDVMLFYARRDTNPEQFYPRGPGGKIRKYDDLPVEYHDNVNVEPPFDRQPGDKPSLNATEIDDIIAFMATLTDGWQPPANPGAKRLAAP